MDARVRPQVGPTIPSACVGIGTEIGIPPINASTTATGTPQVTARVSHCISSVSSKEIIVSPCILDGAMQLVLRLDAEVIRPAVPQSDCGDERLPR
jgi:hypothetical protein